MNENVSFYTQQEFQNKCRFTTNILQFNPYPANTDSD